nr:HNH endonuclease [Roseburia hominis]
MICYACKLPWKGLVASHIKPLATCIRQQKMTEAYDKDNGLLLSPNLDAYFDKFDISFDDNGNILLGKDIPNDIKDIIKDYGLDIKILNEERRKYLKYHRNLFNEKNM